MFYLINFSDFVRRLYIPTSSLVLLVTYTYLITIRWPVIRILNFPLQTFTYLREDDVDFWRKLVYRLPHKRMSHISRIVNTSNDAKRRISELRRLISYTSRDEDDQVETGNRSRPPSFPLTTANAQNHFFQIVQPVKYCIY